MNAEYDGNALGGPLGSLFAIDVTSAVIVCCGCGRQGALATLHVYDAGPGLVACCTGCESVVMRYARFEIVFW